MPTEVIEPENPKFIVEVELKHVYKNEFEAKVKYKPVEDGAKVEENELSED